MLNCILAVVVEAGAAAAAADEHDKAMNREKLIVKAESQLINLCSGLDADNSGDLDIKEFLDGFHKNADFRECLEVMHVTESDMMMIFNICDEDDSGDVDYREFVEQLRRIKHSGEQMLLHYVTDIRHIVNRIRPECLKPPARKAPPGGEQDKQEIKFDLSADDNPSGETPGDLTALIGVNDVAKQSEEQTGLFNALVSSGVQGGTAHRPMTRGTPDSVTSAARVLGAGCASGGLGGLGEVLGPNPGSDPYPLQDDGALIRAV